MIDEIHFSKSDFITLFRRNDEYGTVVIQENDLAEYSNREERMCYSAEQNCSLCCYVLRGSYTGAIAYVTCQEKKALVQRRS